MQSAFPYQIHQTSGGYGAGGHVPTNNSNNNSINQYTSPMSNDNLNIRMAAGYGASAAKAYSNPPSAPPQQPQPQQQPAPQPQQQQQQGSGVYMYQGTGAAPSRITFTQPQPSAPSSGAGTMDMAQLSGLNNPYLNINMGSKLFVGQVPGVCTEDQLRPIFADFGTLLEVKIMREQSGRSKGSAWVRYESEESARRAIEALNEKWVIPPQTNPLRVQFASPSKRMATTAGAELAQAPFRPAGPATLSTAAPHLATAFSTNAGAPMAAAQAYATAPQAPPQQQLYDNLYALNHFRQQQQQHHAPPPSQQQAAAHNASYVYAGNVGAPTASAATAAAAAAAANYAYMMPSAQPPQPQHQRQGY